MRFILASASPRRKELLSCAGFTYETVPADIDETLPEGISPDEAVRTLSEKKAKSVLGNNPDAVVLGSDTVVVLGGKILGKPVDEADAKNMLLSLSGKVHQVYTGLCVCSGEKVRTCVSCVDVHFFPLSERTVDDYIKTGEPMDKAGAYGIQGIGSTLVRGINGDYYAVMGLPLAKAVRILGDFGVTGKIGF